MFQFTYLCFINSNHMIITRTPSFSLLLALLRLVPLIFFVYCHNRRIMSKYSAHLSLSLNFTYLPSFPEIFTLTRASRRREFPFCSKLSTFSPIPVLLHRIYVHLYVLCVCAKVTGGGENRCSSYRY